MENFERYFGVTDDGFSFMQQERTRRKIKLGFEITLRQLQDRLESLQRELDSLRHRIVNGSTEEIISLAYVRLDLVEVQDLITELKNEESLMFEGDEK